MHLAEPSSNGSTPTSDGFSSESIYSTRVHYTSGGLPLTDVFFFFSLRRRDIADHDVYKKENGTVWLTARCVAGVAARTEPTKR